MIIKDNFSAEEIERTARIKTWLASEFPAPAHSWHGPEYRGTVRPPRMGFYLSAQGTPKHFVVIEEAYLADHAADVIGPLKEWGLILKLKELRGTKRVVVSERPPLGEEEVG